MKQQYELSGKRGNELSVGGVFVLLSAILILTFILSFAVSILIYRSFVGYLELSKTICRHMFSVGTFFESLGLVVTGIFVPVIVDFLQKGTSGSGDDENGRILLKRYRIFNNWKIGATLLLLFLSFVVAIFIILAFCGLFVAPGGASSLGEGIEYPKLPEVVLLILTIFVLWFAYGYVFDEDQFKGYEDLKRLEDYNVAKSHLASLSDELVESYYEFEIRRLSRTIIVMKWARNKRFDSLFFGSVSNRLWHYLHLVPALFLLFIPILLSYLLAYLCNVSLDFFTGDYVYLVLVSTVAFVFLERWHSEEEVGNMLSFILGERRYFLSRFIRFLQVIFVLLIVALELILSGFASIPLVGGAYVRMSVLMAVSLICCFLAFNYLYAFMTFNTSSLEEKIESERNRARQVISEYEVLLLEDSEKVPERSGWRRLFPFCVR